MKVEIQPRSGKPSPRSRYHEFVLRLIEAQATPNQAVVVTFETDEEAKFVSRLRGHLSSWQVRKRYFGQEEGDPLDVRLCAHYRSKKQVELWLERVKPRRKAITLPDDAHLSPPATH